MHNVSPLLARYATERTGDAHIPGYYCEERMQWVIDVGNGCRPIIDADCDLAELKTKTEVRQEADDESKPALLEITTKTKVEQEADDQIPQALLEVTTKTHAQVESEDRKITVDFL